MSRKNGFSRKTKRQAIERQNGMCGFCGVLLIASWTKGKYRGYAHHHTRFCSLMGLDESHLQIV